MSEADVIHTITDTFENIHVIESNGNRFFYLGPFSLENNQFPFTTLVTNDDYDQFSDLNRPSVFRLNIGVSKDTFKSVLGEENDGAEPDFTALDTLLPHPVYGKMHWVCVLNPGARTTETVKILLAEAYTREKQKQERRGN